MLKVIKEISTAQQITHSECRKKFTEQTPEKTELSGRKEQD